MSYNWKIIVENDGIDKFLKNVCGTLFLIFNLKNKIFHLITSITQFLNYLSFNA